MSNPTTEQWRWRLAQFVPSFLQNHPVLAPLAKDGSSLLHGSTSRGVDDAVSDVDLWLLVPPDAMRRFDTSGPNFFEFTLANKAGHLQVKPFEAAEQQVERCDMPLIYELRNALVLTDSTGRGRALVDRARQPMRQDVRCAWFAHHYIEMRSEHRAADNPIERRDPVAVLQAVTATLSHALRAAMVLDREPYPYVKWLARASTGTPTGQLLAPIVEQLIDLIGDGSLRVGGPERQHPISLKLKEIRAILVDRARAAGVNAPWLKDWYLHLDLRSQIDRVTWSERSSC